MPRGPLSDEHKAKLKAGREAACAANKGKKPRKKREPREPAYEFNVDEKGELNIVDANDGAGLTLAPEVAERLRVFLNRALPHAGKTPLAELDAAIRRNVDIASQAERV